MAFTNHVVALREKRAPFTADDYDGSWPSLLFAESCKKSAPSPFSGLHKRLLLLLLLLSL